MTTVARILYRRQHPNDRPTSRQSGCQCRERQVQRLSPVSKRLRDAVIGEYSSAASIPLLLFRSGPSAITRLVITECVDTVKRLALGPLSHIQQEILERPPAITDSDTTPAIAGIRSGVGVEAPLYHRSPANVGTRCTHGVSAIMSVFNASTTARAAPATQHSIGPSEHVGPARATTAPERVSFQLSVITQYEQSAKRLADEVFKTSRTEAPARLGLAATKLFADNRRFAAAITRAQPYIAAVLASDECLHAQSSELLSGVIKSRFQMRSFYYIAGAVAP
jgi:hypothetical protein